MSDLVPTQPTEAQAKAAFDVEARIKGHVHVMRATWVRLAEDLHSFVEAQMWRDLGNSSFESWLATPDVEISRRQAYYLLDMWRELVIKRGVKPKELEGVEVSKVQEVLPAVRRGYVDVDDALTACKTLGRDDLRQEYSTAGTDPPAANSTVLDPGSEPAWAVCGACGSSYRVKP